MKAALLVWNYEMNMDSVHVLKMYKFYENGEPLITYSQ